MSDDVTTADELEAAGFTVEWASQLPIATYHNDEGEPFWLRDDLEPWLTAEGDEP